MTSSTVAVTEVTAPRADDALTISSPVPWAAFISDPFWSLNERREAGILLEPGIESAAGESAVYANGAALDRADGSGIEPAFDAHQYVTTAPLVFDVGDYRRSISSDAPHNWGTGRE
jgi:hypothetical protein